MLKKKSLLVGALSSALLVLPLTNVSAKSPTVPQLEAQITAFKNQVNEQQKQIKDQQKTITKQQNTINQNDKTISNLQSQLKGSVVTKGNLPTYYYNQIQEVAYPLQSNLQM